MFRIINRKGFWKRFFLNLLFNLPLFIMIRYFTFPERLFTIPGVIFICVMSIALSFATASTQTKTAIINEDEEEGLRYESRNLSYYLRLFVFSTLFIGIILGLFLLVAIPFFVFIWNEPLSFQDWSKYLLLIPLLALYATISDWLANRIRRGKKPY